MPRGSLLAVLIAASALLPAAAQERSITVASTTSTEQSGLFDHLLPAFTARTGIAVKVVALGRKAWLFVGSDDTDTAVAVLDRE